LSSVPVTIFADFSCPYSFLTEVVLQRRHAHDTELLPRAHELFPEPAALPDPIFNAGDWRAIEELAAAADVTLRPPAFRPRTRKAHEAARFAREAGTEFQMRREIYRAYWTEGLDIGRIDVLSTLAARVDLDAEALRIALDIDRFTEVVRHDEELGRRLHVPGTPTIYIGFGPSARVLVGASSAPDLNRYVDEAIHTRANDAHNG
jgi:predicted DsbA family dithiol-disulfide isomerase